MSCCRLYQAWKTGRASLCDGLREAYLSSENHFKTECARTQAPVDCRDKVLLLNKTTEVINFWQDEEKKHSLEEAQAQFPDCKFQGA